MKLHIAILFVAAFAFGSCKSNSTSTTSSNNGGGGGTPPANTMYISVGGVTDSLMASAITTTNSGVTNTSVTGVNTAGLGCNFTLENISTAGTYQVGTFGFNNGTVNGVIMIYSYKDAQGNSVVYTSPTSGATSVGSLTISAISSTAIQATFSNCTLTLQSGNGPQTAVITSGSVNATIS